MAANRRERPSIDPRRALSICELAEAASAEFLSASGADLDAILNESSIDLFCDSFSEDFDGLLIKDSKGFRIACNLATGNEPKSPRGRFTIAHELGHYFIDEHRSVLIDCLMPSMGEKAIEDNIMEREADLFASHLLLPSQLVRKAYKKSGGGLNGIRTMASKFGTSLKCSAIRYVEEDIWPCCLTFRNWDGQLKWRWFSRKAWLAGIRNVSEEMISKSATEQVIKRSEEEFAIIDSAFPAHYVFPFIDKQNWNEIIKEESMSLGEYGVLSLFTSQKQNLPTVADVLDRRYAR